MVDILIVLIVVLGLIWGVKKGFISALFSFVSIFLSLILVYLLEDIFVDAIARSPVGDFIGNFIAAKYSPIVAEKCAQAIITMVAIVLLYFLVKLALRVFGSLLDSLSKLPIINTINKIAGALIGVIVGGIWVVIIVNVLCYIPQFSDSVFNSYIVDAFGMLVH